MLTMIRRIGSSDLIDKAERLLCIHECCMDFIGQHTSTDCYLTAPT